MELYCFSDYCKYNDYGYCTCENGIVIGSDGECTNLSYYKDAPEYQTTYFKAMCKKGKMFKQEATGRKIECNGLTLYYETKELKPETDCTEETTGRGAPFEYFQNPENAKHVKEIIASGEYANVNDLPLKNEME